VKRYTDHAANERTWLAWIRTAIAIIAFGFIIERFELFTAYVTASLGGQAQMPARDLNPLALLLVGAGILVIVLATLRYHRHRHMIEDDSEAPYGSSSTVTGLAALLVVVALVLSWLIL